MNLVYQLFLQQGVYILFRRQDLYNLGSALKL